MSLNYLVNNNRKCITVYENTCKKNDMLFSYLKQINQENSHIKLIRRTEALKPK